MSPENEKKINEKFGYIIRSDKSPQHGLHMFGFECGDGWFDLLWTLLTEIEKSLAAEPKEVVDNFSVVQVKEKYGTLRFYCNGTTDAIDSLISAAEDVSEKTCEACGQPGEIRPGGWISVQCWDHYVSILVNNIISYCVDKEVSEEEKFSKFSGNSMGMFAAYKDQEEMKKYLTKQLSFHFGPKKGDRECLK